MDDSTATESEHARRLLEGMARAVAEKGYGEATIADIVREAGVSRRTFYEHFGTKAECLIALYETASLKVLDVLRQAIDPRQHWDAQLEGALGAYFAAMAANPVLLRTLFVEILGLGNEGLAARRRVNQQIAEFVLFVANSPSAKRKLKLSAQMAVAVVGGINELVLTYIESDRVSALTELVAPASELVRAAVLAPDSR